MIHPRDVLSFYFRPRFSPTAIEKEPFSLTLFRDGAALPRDSSRRRRARHRIVAVVIVVVVLDADAVVVVVQPQRRQSSCDPIVVSPIRPTRRHQKRHHAPYHD